LSTKTEGNTNFSNSIEVSIAILFYLTKVDKYILYSTTF